jgi:hypothetical protein
MLRSVVPFDVCKTLRNFCVALRIESSLLRSSSDISARIQIALNLE